MVTDPCCSLVLIYQVRVQEGSITSSCITRETPLCVPGAQFQAADAEASALAAAAQKGRNGAGPASSESRPSPAPKSVATKSEVAPYLSLQPGTSPPGDPPPWQYLSILTYSPGRRIYAPGPSANSRQWPCTQFQWDHLTTKCCSGTNDVAVGQEELCLLRQGRTELQGHS